MAASGWVKQHQRLRLPFGLFGGRFIARQSTGYFAVNCIAVDSLIYIMNRFLNATVFVSMCRYHPHAETVECH